MDAAKPVDACRGCCCMTQFLLIRHALNDTVGVRFAGRAPGVVLNEEGEQQALKLAERLAGEPIKAIYSSPLERSIATAKPLAEKLGLKVEMVNEFTELDLG